MRKTHRRFRKDVEVPISRVLCLPEKGGPDHSSRPPVAERLKQPTRELRAGHPQTLPYLALLRVGFAELPVSPPGLVSSYLTVSPLPSTPFAVAPSRGEATPKGVLGGLLSVALSCSSPRLGVTQHPALRSPDFPPVPQRNRRSGGHLHIRYEGIQKRGFVQAEGGLLRSGPMEGNDGGDARMKKSPLRRGDHGPHPVLSRSGGCFGGPTG